jgi:hypothetical protein
MYGDEILKSSHVKKTTITITIYDSWPVQYLYTAVLNTYIYIYAQTGNQNGGLPKTAVAAQF